MDRNQSTTESQGVGVCFIQVGNRGRAFLSQFRFRRVNLEWGDGQRGGCALLKKGEADQQKECVWLWHQPWWMRDGVQSEFRLHPEGIQAIYRKRILHGPIPSWKQRIVCTTSNSSPLFLFSHVFPWIDCRRNNIVSYSFYTPFHFHFTTPKSKYVPNPFSYVCVRHTFLYSYLMGIVNSRIEDKKSFSIVMPGTEDLSTGSV